MYMYADGGGGNKTCGMLHERKRRLKQKLYARLNEQTRRGVNRQMQKRPLTLVEVSEVNNLFSML